MLGTQTNAISKNAILKPYWNPSEPTTA